MPDPDRWRCIELRDEQGEAESEQDAAVAWQHTRAPNRDSGQGAKPMELPASPELPAAVIEQARGVASVPTG